MDIDKSVYLLFKRIANTRIKQTDKYDDRQMVEFITEGLSTKLKH